MAGLSPLSGRYNGFTLGAFLACMRFPFAERRYDGFRQRVQDFLDEVDVGARVPATWEEFAPRADDLLRHAIAEGRKRSEELSDFIGIGAMAALQGANAGLVRDDHRRALRDRWLPALERHGVSAARYDEWLDALPRDTAAVVAEDSLAPASLLLAFALEPLDPDPATCFVAMPFREPFVGYFTRFYRPALQRAGMQAIRAWGGLSSEEYYMFLLTLISRSGAALAELTTMNPNVINEVGIAHGNGKVVFLIGRDPLSDVPSNIEQLPILLYRDEGDGWLPEAVDQCAKYIARMRDDFDARSARA